MVRRLFFVAPEPKKQGPLSRVAPGEKANSTPSILPASPPTFAVQGENPGLYRGPGSIFDFSRLGATGVFGGNTLFFSLASFNILPNMPDFRPQELCDYPIK